MSSSHESFLTRLLAGVLACIGLQGLSVHVLSWLDLLPWCWLPAVAILIVFMVWTTRCWRLAGSEARGALICAWSWPGPWIFAALMLTQIAIYPPSMSDSLCYRLPRLFLALQDGGIGRFETPDGRMNAMPWGWGLMAMPFASLNLLGWSRLVNLATWLVIYQMLHAWACQSKMPRTHGAPTSAGSCSSPSRARWIALALATAPVMLLQASSTANDLYAGGLLLVGVWMIRRFHRSPGPVPVMASLFALILAANVKPQFLVMGLPWLAWWAFSPGKPWRRVPWWGLAAAFPLYLLLSPLPLLAVNHHLHGSMLGDPEASGLGPAAPAWLMAVAGSVQFTVSQFQLPVFPGAETINAWLAAFPPFEAIGRDIPKFSPGVPLMPAIDGASFGILHIMLLAMGFFGVVRRGHREEWYCLAALLFGVVVAASQVVPATIGRSFMGFIALLLPSAAIGLAIRPAGKILPLACAAAILGGLATLLLNPSAPLWPSRMLENYVRDHGKTGLADKLEAYHSYQRRALVAAGVLDPVPRGEPIAILIRASTPVAGLWKPDWRKHRIDYVNFVKPSEFTAGPHQWLLIAGKVVEYQPDAFKAYSNLPGWERVSEHEYLPTLKQGPETWTLYRRIR